MEIYGCTYLEYVKKYENRLSLYLERYEDRTESLFLEKELINFKDFHNVLVSLHNSIVQHKNHNNLINDDQFKTHLTYLQNNYNNVFKELFQIGPPLLDANKNVSHPDDIKEDDVRGHMFYFDITKEKLDNFITSSKRILEFINKKQYSEVPGGEINVNDKTNDSAEMTANPYSHIFKNLEAYKLFEKLYVTFKDSSFILADFSFIYRKMYSEGYILETFKSEMFVRWIGGEPYYISLDKTKTLTNCTTKSKLQTYKTTKELLGIK